MQVIWIRGTILCILLTLICLLCAPESDEPIFELPVQLVGFPIIIAAVRISNFVRKLAYSLDPETYRSRDKRHLSRPISDDYWDAERIGKELAAELGEDVCIYEKICSNYARNKFMQGDEEQSLDWNNINRHYNSLPDSRRNNYLLNIFIGDIFGSPKLCSQLAKERRACSL